MSAGTIGRLGAVLALTVGSLVGAAAVTVPAQALTSCGEVFNYHLNAPYNIQATNGYVCDNRETAEVIGIYKNGVLVASGVGSAAYVCNGSASNQYTIEGWNAGAGPFTLNCG